MSALTEVATNLELARAAWRIRSASPKQVASVVRMCRAIMKQMGLNPNDRDARLRLLSRLLGREMLSTNYLFGHEASVLLGAYHRIPAEQFAEELMECSPAD